MDATNEYRLTTPVFFIDGRAPEETMVYAPLLRMAFPTDQRGVALLSRLRAGVPESGLLPAEREFVRSLAASGLFADVPAPAPTRGFDGFDAYRPTTGTLFLTGKCNLHCSYCYARGGDTEAVMDWPVARAAIDFLVENALATAKPGITVIFHGDGEPTLAWPLLRRSIEYAEDRTGVEGLTCRFEAGLNGILADAQLRFLAPKLSNITLSLDGPPDIHDAQRPFAGGAHADSEHSPTTPSTVVRRTLATLDELGIDYGIRCTVTARSVGRLPEVVRYICSVSACRTIQFEPSFVVGRAADTAQPEVDAETFVRGFLEARLVAREHGRRIAYAGARPDQITDRFCEASRGAFNVTQDGRLTSCYEVFAPDDPRAEHFQYGRLDAETGNVSLDEEILRRGSAWSSSIKKPCASCFARFHCGGDCAAKLAATGDPGTTVDANRCYVIREITRAQLFTLYGFGDVVAPSRPWQMVQSRSVPASQGLFQLRVPKRKATSRGVEPRTGGT